jgi:hypothetical protein
LPWVTGSMIAFTYSIIPVDSGSKMWMSSNLVPQSAALTSKQQEASLWPVLLTSTESAWLCYMHGESVFILQVDPSHMPHKRHRLSIDIVKICLYSDHFLCQSKPAALCASLLSPEVCAWYWYPRMSGSGTHACVEGKCSCINHALFYSYINCISSWMAALLSPP